MTLDLSTLFMAFGVFSGLLLSPLLLFSWRGNIQANRLLGLVIGCMTLSLAVPLILELVDDIRQHTYLIRSGSALSFLFGPLALLYVQACTEEDFRFRPQQWLHFVPALLDLAFHVPFYLQNPEEKMEYLRDLQDGRPQTEYLVLLGLKVLHLFIYFLLSQRLISQYHRYLKEVRTYIDPSYETWLRIFTADLLLIVCMAFGLWLTRFSDALQVATFLAMISLILIVQMAALIKPEIFHGFPEPRKPDLPGDQTRSLLPTAEKEKLYQKLLAHMVEKRPFEDPELSLDRLAEALGTKRNYLSLVINELAGKNFMDFINSYRVEEAKKRLVDPGNQEFTILSVAFDVGFNSKSAFYTAFRKMTGMTPSRYKSTALPRQRA